MIKLLSSPGYNICEFKIENSFENPTQIQIY